jgi:thioredoxin:protein disulfide reductase
LKQSISILFLVYGLLVLIGASLGNHNPLQPLEGLSVKNNSIDYRSKPTLSEHIVTTSAALTACLSQHQGEPVMLDFYADWCTSCKVMEATTLNDPALKQALEGLID